MKRLFIIVLLIIPINVYGTSASSMIAMDLDNDYIYFEKNINEKRLIASITKIMTAIVTIENIDIEKKITVKEEVLKAYGSAIYINVGEQITIKDLLYGLMLRSGNDAAITIAINVAGSMENFASLMNELANKIGMKNTYFVNSHGLENNDTANVSTAKDMAILTKYAMNNKTFKEIFKTKKYIAKSSEKTYSWTNKNKLLHTESYITGGKTGFTKKARRTLVTTGSRNNLNVVVVTLNDANDFKNHKNMYENIFKNFVAVKVLDKDKIKIKEEKIYKKGNLYLEKDIYIPTKSKKDKIQIDYNLYNSKRYVNQDIVGYVTVSLNNKEIRKENIYIKVKEKKSNLNLWDKIKRWLNW